jgi:hypothetical protein
MEEVCGGVHVELHESHRWADLAEAY